MLTVRTGDSVRTYSEGGLGSPRYTPAMQYHLLQHDLTRILHPQCYHSQAVPHKDDIHTGMIGDVSARKVMGGDHGNGFILLMECAEGVDGDLLPLRS